MKTLPIRAAAVIAAVYGYFLIFAQFAFVELLRSDFIRRPDSGWVSHGNEEKIILGIMAASGIAAGFFTAWKGSTPAKIRFGLVIAAIASALAPWVHGTLSLIFIALMAGMAIGLSTVGLATLVRSWGGLLWVGLGTGMGYAACNLPVVFSQSPTHQAWIATAFAVMGSICIPAQPGTAHESSRPTFPLPAALLVFTALVWFDSAAFFIIQHVPDFKAGTWGEGSLWRNAAVHLLAAIIAGFWLKKNGTRILPFVAWILLAMAASAVNHDSMRPLCGWLYPAAVSLYSTALVAWPGWFSGAADNRRIGWRAAWLYAVAGWFGSANGIGMAQTLQRVPREFILVSGICIAGVMLFSFRKHWRVILLIAIVASPLLLPSSKKPSVFLNASERGRQVYLSEGCIHCHSQYVRPGTRDEELWGPPSETMPLSRPVLIGNRRQGPDLSNIGARRSSTWLKEHFQNPQAFSPGSPMPSYAHLFKDGKGDDLITYLQQSGIRHIPDLIEKSSIWSPSATTPSHDGRALFASQCAICHGAEGTGNGSISGKLPKPPADLVNGPFVWSPATDDQELKIARIVKFGIPGTDMPGHETLMDEQVLALRDYVLGLRRKHH